MEIQWRNLAKAYYETYVSLLGEKGQLIEERFEDLSEDEVNAMIEAIKYTCILFGDAVTA